MNCISKRCCLFFFLALSIPVFSFSQFCIGNWLNTPSNQSFVSIGDLDIPGNTITVEAIFTRTAPYSGGYNWAGDLVSKHNDPSNVNYLLRPNNAEITTSNGFFTTPPICEIQLNKTYHVAMTYDGTRLRFYRNGALMSSVPATGNLFQNNFLTKIGIYDATVNNTQLIGYINEVRIWNVVRSQAQIQANMGSDLANPTTQSGLLAYYRFDNLLNKQGNPAWNGVLGGTATINRTNPNCNWIPDSCNVQNTQIIINDYTPVTGFYPCQNILLVEDDTEFNIGDTVLLIQMKGANFEPSNSAAFGTVTNYNNAGNYEFNIVKSKFGNAIELLNTIVRSYDIPGGKVQLVRVPYFQNYTPPGILTCLPWDGSKGGILAFNVQNTLTLNNDINVSGKGFRGGKGVNTNQTSTHCFSNNFSYPFGSVFGAAKGESIVELPTIHQLGKGNAAGGGGGGNDHNSGGAGGGNGGIGGFGGYQYEPCGSAPFDNRGIGGRTLSYSNALNRIYLGNGGGAGHANNAVNASIEFNGGNGGGIIIFNAGSIASNNFKIISNGSDAPSYTPNGSQHMHESTGGGGSGGTILVGIGNATTNTTIEARGGKGADMKADAILYGRIGSGGGGGGGVIWTAGPSLPANINTDLTGGTNGVLTMDGNNSWGATPGQNGIALTNLLLPVATTLFKPNIDSVRIRATAQGCNSFSFEGLGYVNTNPVSSWQWTFGDGNTASVQNPNHTYTSSGTFPVKLVITDLNGCKDSISIDVMTSAMNFDFNYQLNACSPLTIQFNGLGSTTSGPYWSFGDGNTHTAGNSPTHTYSAAGNYIVKYSVTNGACRDTVTKTISIGSVFDNIIITPDTTICATNSKQLRTLPSLSFCWTPTTYLDNPNSPNPIATPSQPITYHFTAEMLGGNLISNGDFSQGNSGFTSEYQFSTSGLNGGTYGVGSNILSWHPGMAACTDHTSGSGNMMMVNGSSQANVNVWKQTVNVQPNTNYAFTCWLQHITSLNPAQLQFSINGRPLGNVFNANSTSCVWEKFYVMWNSGNNTTAVISILNQNQVLSGNDFALDDISFSPVFIKQDSVKITIDVPVVRSINDTTLCKGATIQMSTSGAQTYSWSPAVGLNNATISNPVATVNNPTDYYVTGTTASGCIAKDTVKITLHPQATISVTNDTTICTNSTLQLNASGGSQYSWSPPSTLNATTIPNPVASPTSNTLYYVNVTDANNCNYKDSVQVNIKAIPVFTINGPVKLCLEDTIQLSASGGNIYSWQPAIDINDPTISSPQVFPLTTATYSVTITESTCNISQTLSTEVTVVPLPNVDATRSNDIDCSNNQSQLLATGAVQYLWSPSGSLNSGSLPNPIASSQATTQYLVIGTDNNGCENTDTVTVKVINANKGGYLMANGFTPNNDGTNDCYGIKYWGIIEKLEFSIFNRWGERVFYTTDATRCWDGTYKGIKQDSGVYVYMIRANTTCESTVFRKGSFVLIR